MENPLIDVRGSSRYDAKRSAIYLGWWEEPDFRTVPASLRNLSHGGALVHLETLPPDGVSLYLCLAQAPPNEWVEVEPVAITQAGQGTRQLHVKFVEACPYRLFQSAALGLELGS